jgi:acyl-coenzyme A thioesterase PaaI-like protein
VSSSAAPFLGLRSADGGSFWHLDVGRELHGAFGGAFGGVLAAACVAAARHVPGGRIPVSLDCRFVRGLPAGPARLSTSLVHGGRSLSFLRVEVFDASGKLSTYATIGFADLAALANTVAACGEPDRWWRPYAEGSPWTSPPGIDIPMLTSLAPRVVGSRDSAVAAALCVPWDDPDAAAEAACLAADLCVGPPVARALGGNWRPHPNPDLSLRFTGRRSGREVVGVGRLNSLDAGIATVTIEAYSGTDLLAVGVSTSLVLH